MNEYSQVREHSTDCLQYVYLVPVTPPPILPAVTSILAYTFCTSHCSVVWFGVRGRYAALAESLLRQSILCLTLYF
jgi:hypothetical protein